LWNDQPMTYCEPFFGGMGLPALDDCADVSGAAALPMSASARVALIAIAAFRVRPMAVLVTRALLRLPAASDVGRPGA
jgi:hypothetical protein